MWFLLLQIIGHVFFRNSGVDGALAESNSAYESFFNRTLLQEGHLWDRYPPACGSVIYCHGPLIHTVQMARLDRDSKTFVDQKMLNSPSVIIQNFEAMEAATQKHPTRDQVREFVYQNFGPSGSELVSWIPPDWTDNPKFVDTIKDTNLQLYALELNEIWKVLGRRIIPDVAVHEDRYSLIYVPNPVIVPGGRFKEFYYWDQYWILKGLLHCEMYQTVQKMIENFFHMVRRFGYVPNGGRVYYSRSQPPMLIPMVQDYATVTGNWSFVEENLEVLDQEFAFWLNNRSIHVESGGQTYRFVRYDDELTGPRPESYREDYELAQKLPTETERDELYVDLKSGAESGWDFSTRWFAPVQGFESANLVHIKTREVIPADLNAFLYNNARLMASFHAKFNKTEKSENYARIADEWERSINSVLWNESLGCWFDYDWKRQEQRTEFYPSDVAPLWAGISVGGDIKATAVRVVNYLHNSGALSFPGGIPTSMQHSGEQWDFPNGWAPLQHLVVDALDRSGSPQAQAVALDIAQRWVKNNYRAFRSSNNTMFEKYDVQSVGAPGGGGEYEVVVGFGWSNGVILDFLSRFGQSLVGIF